MPFLARKVGVILALVLGVCFFFVMLRTSIDAESRQQIGQGISSIPFSSIALSVVQRFIPLDKTFTITNTDNIFMSLLVLFIQTLIQSPVMLLINNTMGPILMRSNAREYSIVGDSNIKRTKTKIIKKISKVIVLIIFIPLLAFSISKLLQMGFDWVNSQNIIVTILIYLLIIALFAGIIALPILVNNTRKFFKKFGIDLLQRFIYVAITNIMVIAVVATLIAGINGWHFSFVLLAFVIWMTIYSDTDGFISKYYYRNI